MDHDLTIAGHGEPSGRPRPLRGVARFATPRRLAGNMLLLWAVVLSGCAVTQETRQSLAGYVQAMEQVDQSANMFLTDFSDGRKVARELARIAGAGPAPAAPAYPTKLELPGDPNDPQSADEKALYSTQQALAVVRQYNNALVALAEGRSEQDIRIATQQFGATLEGLGSIVGASLPGLGLFTAVGQQILKLAQDAANRQQLEEAVKKGRAPVGEILKVLEAQTPVMYEASVKDTQVSLDTPGDAIQRVAKTMTGLIGRQGPPTDVGVASAMAAFQGELRQIGVRTGTFDSLPIPPIYKNGSPAYDAAAHAEVSIFMQSMRSNAQRYTEVVAKQNAYHDLMLKYVTTLRQTRRSLDLVADSLAKPVDLRAEVGRLLKVAFDLRDAMAAYRNPLPAPASP